MGEVVSQEELLGRRATWSVDGSRVALVAGRFDLLHPGHIRLLEQARSHGGVIVVGVFDDNLAKAKISQEKPESFSGAASSTFGGSCGPAAERAEILAALAAVDYVFALRTTDLGAFLTAFHPDVVVDGAEISPAKSPLATAAASVGIEVFRIALEPGHSSSRLIDRIIQLRA